MTRPTESHAATDSQQSISPDPDGAATVDTPTPNNVTAQEAADPQSASAPASPTQATAVADSASEESSSGSGNIFGIIVGVIVFVWAARRERKLRAARKATLAPKTNYRL